MLSITFLMLVASVAGHGWPNRTFTPSNGEIHEARLPWQSLAKDTAIRPAWQTDPSKGQALIESPDFGDASKMSCGKSAALPAPAVISIAAGDDITLYWRGPTDELAAYIKDPEGGLPYTHAIGVIGDYMASCNGDCASADVTDAGWTKVQEATFDPDTVMDQKLRDIMVARGENHPDAAAPGLWALAKFQQDGSAWTLKVPENLEPGQYIWRNELVAMHFDTPQLFIACTQLEVTGSGSTPLPAGTKSSELYDPEGVFKNFVISPQNSATFEYPGPALWSAAAQGSAGSPVKSSASDVIGQKTVTSASAGKSSSSSRLVPRPSGNTLPVEDAPIDFATDVDEDQPSSAVRPRPTATDLAAEDSERPVTIQTSSASTTRFTGRPHWRSQWRNFRGSQE